LITGFIGVDVAVLVIVDVVVDVDVLVNGFYTV
jgi:hypothetical protein